jgi:bifunctional lysine-specific demethylase and histidyl-hydroxylase NO66
MLEQFLGALSREVFFRDYWGKQPLQSANRGLLDPPLFSLRDLVNVVAYLRPRDARLRIVDEGVEVQKLELDEDTHAVLTTALSRGMTASLERLDRYWPPVVELCGAVAAQLGCPVHANMYLTPGGLSGLSQHYDTHDVFVLQLEGEKHWSLGQIEVALPTEDIADGVVSEMRTHRQLVLHPGDVLYVPRGMAHCARSTSGHSMHLSIGCIPYTTGDTLLELVRAASRQLPALRSSWPQLGAHASDAGDGEQLSSLLCQITALVNTGAVPPPTRRMPPQTRRPYQVEDALSRLRSALDVARITSTSRFAVKHPQQLELTRSPGEGWVLQGGTRSATVEEELLPVVRTIAAARGGFSVSDLPPELDRQHVLRAIVRLVSASLLEVV